MKGENQMTKQEVKELIIELEHKEANKRNLTALEITILDVHRVMSKEGKQITDKEIHELKFWMD